MGRVVILEGPDGGGKTTLAKKLVDAGFKYRHEGPPPAQVDIVAYYLKILYDSLRSTDHIVHDRLWLGERVYGPVRRGSDRLGDLGQKLFERLHHSKPIQQYICLPNMTLARQNYSIKIKESDDYLKSFESWEQVFKIYEAWQKSNSILGPVYDYSIVSAKSVVESALSYKNTLRNLPEGTIGSPDAKYLFVGDVVNHASIDVPFFAVTGSSGYFNKALELLNLREEDISITNAKAPNGKSHSLGSILAKLPNLVYIILMGGVAKEWFAGQSDLRDTYKIVNVPHPSYLKRFRGHNPAVMAEILHKGIYG
jgi:hypothetical protein